MAEPEFALSIMQPWAWLIANGLKDIENRDWSTRFRGRVLIHAGKAVDQCAIDDVMEDINPVTGRSMVFGTPDRFDTGGIVGAVDIIDCLERSASSWFVGRYGFLLCNAEPLPFRPCKGALGFFRPDYAAAYKVPTPKVKKAPPPDLFTPPDKRED